MSRNFSKEKERLEKLISDLQNQEQEIKNRIEKGDNRREIIEHYTQFDHLTREIVEEIIDYVVVGKRIPKTRVVPIEIHWKF